MLIDLQVVTHNDLKTMRLELMLEAEQLLKKIISLNTRYNGKLNKVKNKIREIEEQLK